MKKSLSTILALTLSAGITGTALASSIFSDVPEKHWSYDAVNQLAKDGIIEGYQDGTYRGDHVLSRYEMAIIVARAMTKVDQASAQDQALIRKLEAEYATEIDKLNDKYDKLDKRVDKVMLSGFVRAKYDSDTSNGLSTNVNKHFYMNLEGKMKVDDQWDAHFQSETRKGYTANGQYWRTKGDDDQDGTFQRIWVEGRNGQVGVTMGKKWWGYGFQNVAFGHAANGIQLDYNFSPSWKGSVFSLRPTQGNLMSMADGSVDSQSANIKGVNFVGKLGKNLEANLVLAGNDDKDVQKMDRWGSLDLRTKLNQNLVLTTTYAKTNADLEDSSQEYRLDYKGVDLNKVGSFGAYVRYVNFGKYGDASHDDEWCSLPTDMKGWIFGVTYVPYKNVQWETFYSEQKLNISGLSTGDYNYGTGTAVEQNAKRKLIRTQLDFHF
ncbi:S-layer homology domain-containing protein [Anaerosinus massiliensis]|uniref:S-layer homology domain-containing protein n=1 Tax=Massilibacillus massiliensis TaxID=1806837 RepID=UPI000DA61323|nr:S-layer homology domain-containing protein [Massilibacillus massiliensis]